MIPLETLLLFLVTTFRVGNLSCQWVQPKYNHYR